MKHGAWDEIMKKQRIQLGMNLKYDKKQSGLSLMKPEQANRHQTYLSRPWHSPTAHLGGLQN
jgi:hypothetical protein